MTSISARLALFLFAATTAPRLAAQNPARTVVVCDAATREAIPYASVYDMRRKSGFYTDSGGRFSLPADGAIRIAATAYESRTVSPPFAGDTFLLASTAIELQEVAVSQRSPVLQTAGSDCEVGGHSTLSSIIGITYASKIRLPDSGYHRIKAVRLQATQGKGDEPLRIQLYLPDSSGAPGTALLPKSLVVSPKRFGRSKKRIALDDQEVVVAGGVLFVAVEWVGTGRPREGWSVRICQNSAPGLSFRKAELSENNGWQPVPAMQLGEGRAGALTMRAAVDYY